MMSIYNLSIYRNFIFVAISNDMEIIAYGENYNVTVWRPKI